MPFTHHLVDGALVAMDGIHHAFEHRIENLARLFGIAVGTSNAPLAFARS
jgi:hypothetical protein